jgi:hypothetical protein
MRETVLDLGATSFGFLMDPEEMKLLVTETERAWRSLDGI